MNSIGFVLAWLAGCLAGLALHALRPDGIERQFGWALLGLAGLTSIPIALAWKQKQARWIGLLTAALLTGLGWTLTQHPPAGPTDLAYYNGSEGSARVRVTGHISAEPVYGDRSQRLRITVDIIALPDRDTPVQVSGDMLALLPRYPSYYVGEQLTLDGKLTRPPQVEGFDYAGYLARQGVYSYMLLPEVVARRSGSGPGWLELVSSARQKVKEVLQKGLPEPQAALVTGIVTGDRTSIPEELQEAFSVSGTSHILAISGQNISLLVGFVFLLYSRGQERRKMPLWLLAVVLALLTGYTFFTGATAAVVRASLMSGVLLTSQAVGRRFDPVSALAVSAAIMSVVDPDLLLNAGFILSFAAMVGLVELSPIMLGAFERLNVPGVLGIPLAASFGAQLTTAPLLLLLTGRFSTVSPLATLTTEFTLLPIMIVGIASGLAGVVFQPLGSMLALLAWPPAAWMVEAVRWWASLSAAALDVGSVNIAWIVGYYVLMAVFVWWLREGRTRLKLRFGHFALAVGGIAAWTFLLGGVLVP